MFSSLVYDAVGSQIGTPGNQNDQAVVSNNNILLAADAVSLFPNPASSTLNIETSLTELLEVEIYDLAGKKYSVINANPQRIDVSKLPHGLYSLKLKFNEGLVIKKFIVQ